MPGRPPISTLFPYSSLFRPDRKSPRLYSSLFFFLNDPPTPEIYPLSLHDALPIPRRHDRNLHHLLLEDRHAEGTLQHLAYLFTRILHGLRAAAASQIRVHHVARAPSRATWCTDRKSTRLNSSHGYISYAVFCLKNK